jgi:lysophospholipase L1-like esterase
MRRLVPSALAFFYACSHAPEASAPPPQKTAPPPVAVAPAKPVLAAAITEPGPDAPPPAPPKRTIDMSKVKVALHVGDSTVGYASGLCVPLGQKLRAAGVEFHTDSWTSAGLQTVASGDKLEKLVAAFHPDLLLLNLGTNNLGYPNADALADLARAVAKKASSVAQCVWIGPPHLPSSDKTEARVVKVLAENAAPCIFFDSQALDLPLQPDHIHPDGTGATRWSANLWSVLVQGGEPAGPFRTGMSATAGSMIFATRDR